MKAGEKGMKKRKDQNAILPCIYYSMKHIKVAHQKTYYIMYYFLPFFETLVYIKPQYTRLLLHWDLSSNESMIQSIIYTTEFLFYGRDGNCEQIVKR